jgi:formylglycine-generating enzyme required for sulfatase activity
MGAVYKARQPLLNRLVALKVMSPHLGADPSFVARFVREASAAANLNHPNMVQVYTAGEADGMHFIAMEFVEGESLQKRLHRLGRIESREAIAITVYVAQALQYAWNKAHLIHRDIKPDNVFLSDSGEVKVGDLGLAKSVGGETTELTQTGAAMGSPHYISPEQATGLKDVDFRTDIYSLGCTLYHMLTGKTPYSGDSSMAVMMKHVNDPPPAIFKTWPACPMPLGMLVGKMLAKDRNARPQSYEQLVDDLLAVHEKIKNMEPARAVAVTPAAPQPKSATPATGAKVARSSAPSAVEKTVAARPSGKPKSRNGIYVAAGAVAVVALGGLLLWSPWKTGEGQNASEQAAALPVETAATPAKSSVFLTETAAAREAAGVPAKFGALFDGRDTSAWQKSDGGPCDWRVEDGALVAGATDLDTREKFQDFELHVEFACPQDRKQGNSGIYIQGRYELQILESFGKPATDTSCGSMFKLKAPTENASKPADEWQEFDITFHAARFDAAGAKTANARVSVMHNGRLIHDNVEIPRSTGKGDEESAAPGPIRLQAYNSPVRFRNISIKPVGTTASAMTASAATALKQLGSVFTNAVGAEMVYIPPGEFMLGSTKEEREWAVKPGNVGVLGVAVRRLKFEGEQAPQQATIRSGFWMGRMEVTVGQWRQFADATGYRSTAEKKGAAVAHGRDDHSIQMVRGASWRNVGFGTPVQDNHPVVCISWDDAMAFCKWLTERERAAGRLPAGYVLRLPAEVEWEYACRGGKQSTRFWWGDSKEDAGGRLNWCKPDSTDDALTPVGSFGERGRNGFGLADMAGNAWEWCLDNLDPAGPHAELYTDDSPLHVLKGGAFRGMAQLYRCATREGQPAGTANFEYGFRVCCGVDVSGKEAGTGTVLPLAEWKNLIPLIDPKRDGIAGGWKVENGRLYCTKRTAWSLCELPVDYKGGNYDLRFRVTRGDGRDVAIFFLFRKGITGGMVLFDHFNTNDSLVAKGVKVAGLTSVKGKPAPHNETRRERPSWLPKGQEKTVLIQVRDEGMVATLDGEEVFRWEGNWEDVTQHENRVFSENKITRPMFGVSSHDCEAVFSAIEMREVAGKGEFTRFGADDAFIREVAALPAEQQVARVVAKLKELNPDFDGKEKHKIEGSDVTELEFSALNVTDISPVRALTKLRRFVCLASTNGKQRSKLSDLTPLRGLSLRELRVPGCDVRDLSPVRGMPLGHFGINYTLVTDLSPLKGAPVDTLNCQGVPIRDLSPLRGAPLKSLMCDGAQVSDLSPLRDSPLEILSCDAAVANSTANQVILKSIPTLKTIKSGRTAQ